MKNGFYTALGTPVDTKGNLVTASFEKQVKRQIDANVSGLLCMGSMGNMVAIKNSEYKKIAASCASTNNGQVPLMVGVMDNSIIRVLDRIDALKDIKKIDGVVATTPYYYVTNQEQIYTFYSSIANQSAFPLFMYDLPGVTQSPIGYETAIKLMKHDNIKGIKSGNMNLISQIMRSGEDTTDFDMLYSGLDTFDIALKGGITKNLDGMFACTPVNSKKMYQGNDSSTYLKNIITLRNLFIKHGVLKSFSYSMELLGCPGIYHEDYSGFINNEAKEEIKAYMSEIGEI